MTFRREHTMNVAKARAEQQVGRLGDQDAGVAAVVDADSTSTST
jgi:hypothetical protein